MTSNHHLWSAIFLEKKLVTFTICHLILSVQDPLLGLYLTGPKVYPILVQLSGTFILIVTKTYLILVFLKTGFQNGNLRVVTAYIYKVGFTEASAPVSSMKLWCFLHICLYKRGLVFKILAFLFIIMFIAF